MPTGSCECGRIRYVYDAEPLFTALCQCDEDHNLPTSACFQIPRGSFTLVIGRPEISSKTSDSNHEISSHSCDNCGTVLFKTGQYPNCVGIRATTLDDAALMAKVMPSIRALTERGPCWNMPVDAAGIAIGKAPMSVESSTVAA